MQTDVLKNHPHADIHVYAVWFNMMVNDSRAKWRAGLLDDRRVKHFWDEPKAVGIWFGDRLNNGEILWDAYLLYGPDAKWADEPDGLISRGRTIMASRATLQADIDRLFSPTPSR